MTSSLEDDSQPNEQEAEREWMCAHCHSQFDDSRYFSLDPFVCPNCGTSAEQLLEVFPESKVLDLDDAFQDNVNVRREGLDIHITRRWHPQFSFRIVFVSVLLFPAGLLLLWAFSWARSGELMIMGLSLFPLIAGAWIFYFAICLFVNRTRICITPHNIVGTHYPLPWPGQRIVKRDQVSRLIVQIMRHPGKNASLTYEVTAITPDKRQLPLVAGLTQLTSISSPEEASCIKTAIERVLGMK